MLDWYTYTDETISVRLPRQLKKTHAPGWLFRGRLRHQDAGTQLVVAIQVDVAAGVVESMTQAAMNPQPAKEWIGATWTYRDVGLSRRRPGGIEVQITQNGPPPCNNAHRWHILYPDGTRWMLVDVFSAMGKLSWVEFKVVASAIMDSVQLRARMCE